MTTLQKTKDYSIFKKNKCNRILDTSNLARIRQSILTQNLLELRPIVVNSDMEVIDGQHRLAVAQELGLEIFYLIDVKAKDENIILLNCNQKSWNASDYLNYYINQGNQEYIRFNQFLEKHHLVISNALLLLLKNGMDTRASFEIFRTGNFIFPSAVEIIEVNNNLAFINTVIDYIKTKTSGNKAYLQRKTFFTSTLEFFSSKYVDKDTFMKKLEFRIDLMHPCTKRSEYKYILKQIYNFRNNNPLTDNQI
jgi:hypothetical protein